MGYKIKRIYQGDKQVRPSWWKYNINFKDYSNISQVKALGWNFRWADSGIVPAVNQTYWLHNSNYINEVRWFWWTYQIPISLSTANKITISVSWYWPSSTSNAAYSSMYLCKDISWNDSWIMGRFRFGSGWATDSFLLLNDSGTVQRTQNVGSWASYSWSFTMTIVIDLSNKLITYNTTWKSLSWNRALTDSDISYIKTLGAIRVGSTAYGGSQVNNQIWSAWIKIE
jgi:hypothetical protein